MSVDKNSLKNDFLLSSLNRNIDDIAEKVKTKTYSDCLDELSKEEVLDGLLGYGLFAEKIPPFLSSESFLEYFKDSSSKDGSSKDGSSKDGSSKDSLRFDGKPRKFVNYYSMRNINIPRALSIPHPIAYARQCETISDNWSELQEYFRRKTKENPYKVSRIHVRKIDNSLKVFKNCYRSPNDIKSDGYLNSIRDHLFEMSHKNSCTDDYPEPELLIGKRYIVKADISNCFPSIYTHSIPWALMGKIEAKQNREKSKWFNKIDKVCRDLKGGETNGILIGPHASNIVSEVVLVAVDEVLTDKYEYTRHIDDYDCYVESHEEAEQFLLDLVSELKKYNLTLNHKKTEVLKLPLASSEHWIRKFNTFAFPDKNKSLKLREVKAFLDIALDLMKHNKENSAILNYAIKVLSSKNLAIDAKKYLVDTAHHLVLLYPYLVHLLDDEVFTAFSVDKCRIEKFSQDIFAMGEKKNLCEAMSYAIYFSIKYDFNLRGDLFGIIDNRGAIGNNNMDAVLMTLAYLHDERFIKNQQISKKYKALAKFLEKDMDEHWIFVYEVLTTTELKGEWKAMKKKEISFIRDGFLK